MKERNNDHLKLAIIAPVFNEDEQTLTKFVTRIITTSKTMFKNVDLLLIDDGSNTFTKLALSHLSEKYREVRILELKKNFGQHAAIASGLENIESDLYVVMDSDLQDPPEFLPKLVEQLAGGYEVVFANRASGNRQFFEFFTSIIFYRTLSLLTGLRFNHQQANFSIITKRVRDDFCSIPSRRIFYSSTIRLLGYQESSVSFTVGKREHGNSSYTFWKRLLLAKNIVLSHSTRLLYLGVFFAFFLGLLSLVAIFTLISWKFLHGDLILAGWTSLVALILALGALLSFVIGIVGLYIAELVKNQNIGKLRQRSLVVGTSKEHTKIVSKLPSN